MTVKLIRMWSGEDVITDIVEETNDYYVIENPIVAVPSPQEGRIAFAPWSPLLQKDKIEVTKKYVVYEGNPCLLYTSPSPRDRISSRMPSSA